MSFFDNNPLNLLGLLLIVAIIALSAWRFRP